MNQQELIRTIKDALKEIVFNLQDYENGNNQENDALRLARDALDLIEDN